MKNTRKKYFNGWIRETPNGLGFDGIQPRCYNDFTVEKTKGKKSSKTFNKKSVIRVNVARGCLPEEQRRYANL